MALKELPGPSFSSRTTLRLGGKALAELRLEGPEDAAYLQEALARTGGEPFALGLGSNILAKDGLLPLCVVSLDTFGEPEQAEGFGWEGKAVVRAGAGIGLPKLLGWLAKRGLSGLEGLAGVPGSLGGSIAGNAGSYGCDLAGVLHRVRIFAPEKGLVWLAKDSFTAGYRRFKPAGINGFYLVVEAELALDRKTPDLVRLGMRQALGKKRSTQPLRAASAGCVFKNPPGESAGRILDELGFRGKSKGKMAFSEIHANFLVNLGGGASGEAMELIYEAKQRVSENRGIELELEVKTI